MLSDSAVRFAKVESGLSALYIYNRLAIPRPAFKLTGAHIISTPMISKLLVNLLCLVVSLAHSNLRQELKDWEFAVEGMFGNEWRVAYIPSNVHLDLLANQLIEDPFDQSNTEIFRNLENSLVTYRTNFVLSEEMEGFYSRELIFDGIDGEANVYLNGEYLFTASSAFVQYTVDVSLKLRKNNTLAVQFEPLLLDFEIEMHNTSKIPNDFGFYRKPAYQYGTELSPRMVTVGIQKQVWIMGYHFVRFDYVWVRTRGIHTVQNQGINYTLADLSLAVKLKGDITALGDNLELAIIVNGHQQAYKPKLTSLVLFHNLTIADAKLWWPRGVGEPYQYQLEFELRAYDFPLQTKKMKYGIRTIHVNLPQAYFNLVVNQYNVYARGAVVIPRDILYPRSIFPHYKHPYRLQQMMDDLEEANVNIVKVWGGGVYESDEFYEECSKRGIMVFQEFMFSSGPYPGHYQFMERCEAEIKYQVRRLRNYPCMAIWSGNHGVLLSSIGWAGNTMLWRNYSASLFDRLIRTIVTMDCPEISYVQSSPNTEMNSQYAGQYNSMWIYESSERIESLATIFGKFSTKFGMPSLPVWQTIESFTTPEDQNYNSKAIKDRHLQQYKFQNMQNYVESYLRETHTFEMEAYQSGIVQAEFIKIAIASQRSNRASTFGSVFWHLNDVWPGITCSTIDYYGRWKPAQYAAKRYFPVVSVFFNQRLFLGEFRKQLQVVAVNDNLFETLALVNIIVVTTEGDMLLNFSKKTILPANSALTAFNITAKSMPNYNKYGKQRVVFYAQIISSKDQMMTSTYYLVRHKDLAIPKAVLNVSYLFESNQITVSSKKLIKDLYISFKGSNYLRLSDNYFDVVPFIPVTVTVKGYYLAQIMDELQYKSYRQTYIKGEKLIVNIV